MVIIIIYKDIWDAIIGEMLQCERELDNESDRYAVAIKKDGTIIGHLPRVISQACSLFLRRGNFISCLATGHRRYSVDLLHRRLEVPCTLRFEGEVKDVVKLKKFVKPDVVVPKWRAVRCVILVLNFLAS